MSVKGTFIDAWCHMVSLDLWVSVSSRGLELDGSRMAGLTPRGLWKQGLSFTESNRCLSCLMVIIIMIVVLIWFLIIIIWYSQCLSNDCFLLQFSFLLRYLDYYHMTILWSCCLYHSAGSAARRWRSPVFVWRALRSTGLGDWEFARLSKAKVSWNQPRLCLEHEDSSHGSVIEGVLTMEDVSYGFIAALQQPKLVLSSGLSENCRNSSTALNCRACDGWWSCWIGKLLIDMRCNSHARFKKINWVEEVVHIQKPALSWLPCLSGSNLVKQSVSRYLFPLNTCWTCNSLLTPDIRIYLCANIGIDVDVNL